MEAIEFLSTAREFLEKQPIREVDCRNAASRAYYCAFHSCKQLLEQHPPNEPQYGSVHDKVIAELLNHQDKRFRKLGNMLKATKKLRTDSDYELQKKFPIQNAKTAIGDVHKLLQEIQNIQSAN
jgi:uncharacterized protein (UPF0332 family)